MRQIEAVVGELAILSIFKLECIDILTRCASYKDIGIWSIFVDYTLNWLVIDTKNSRRTHQLKKMINKQYWPDYESI